MSSSEASNQNYSFDFNFGDRFHTAASFSALAVYKCKTEHNLIQGNNAIRYIVEFPEDLHLSYMDSSPLRELQEEVSAQELARAVAHRSFESLVERTRTVVAVRH